MDRTQPERVLTRWIGTGDGDGWTYGEKLIDEHEAQRIYDAALPEVYIEDNTGARELVDGDPHSVERRMREEA